MMPRQSKVAGRNPDNASSTEKPDNSTSPENIKAAHDQAEHDIEQDPDLSIHSPNDDLDEGETARLGEDKTDLV
jgi:hypothetical protein